MGTMYVMFVGGIVLQCSESAKPARRSATEARMLFVVSTALSGDAEARCDNPPIAFDECDARAARERDRSPLYCECRRVTAIHHHP